LSKDQVPPKTALQYLMNGDSVKNDKLLVQEGVWT